MRHLADVKNKKHAESFVAYLLTLGISTHVEPEGIAKISNSAAAAAGDGVWSVWVRDEDRLPEAIAEFNRFQSSPESPIYQQAIQEARAIVQQKRTEQKLREKNIRTLRPSGNPMMGGPLPPLTLTLVIICVVLGLVTWFGEPGQNNPLGNIAVRELKFVDLSLYVATNDPAASLKKFELWRAFTPAFLHGSAIHLLLNMLSLASLGRLAERLEGIGKYSILLLLMALGSHLPQGLLPPNMFGSPNFVGISGVVMGLFGYLAVKSRLRPDCGFFFPPDAYVMIGMLLVLGFTLPNGLGMANIAHLGGLVTGAILGAVWNR